MDFDLEEDKNILLLLIASDVTNLSGIHPKSRRRLQRRLIKSVCHNFRWELKLKDCIDYRKYSRIIRKTHYL